MTVVLGITFVIILIQTLTYGGLPAATSGFHLSSFALFMTVLSLAAMNMISWAPYVSDYSRYLPEDVSLSKTFWAVMAGNAIPTIFCGIIGAYVASLLPALAGEGIAGAIQHVSGSWALIVLAISLIGSDAVNAYTGMLALASIASCFKDVRDQILTRVVGTVALLITGVVIALLGYGSFVAKVTEFLELLLFVFIPWTAINLTDYFLVKHGEYDIKSFFTPDGIYGGWMWKGLIPYLLAVIIQIPFVTTELYTGPIAKSLSDVNISWIVGGIAAFVFYMVALRIASRGQSGETLKVTDESVPA
jgi:NCS1 family nucleobase:cation symporter-1